MIGIVRDNKCVFADSIVQEGINSKYKAEDPRVVSTDDYEVLQDVKSTSWLHVRNYDPFIPARALSLGYLSFKGLPLKSLYACRILSWSGDSAIGWAMEGNACTFADKGKIQFTSDGQIDNRIMQILVRDAGKVFDLNLAEKP